MTSPILKPHAWLSLLLLSATAQAALGALVAGPDGTAAQGRRLVVAAPVPGVNGAAALAVQTGLIDAVDVAQRQVVLNGRAVALDPALRVVAGGQSLGPDVRVLRAGQQIRFARQAGDAPDRPIVLIYIDRQP